MKVLILAAGYGTRLYPLTKQKPKALLLVKDKPILEYILDKLPLPAAGRQEEIFIISNKKFFPQFQEWFKKWTSPQKDKIKLLHNDSTSPENRLGAVKDIDFVIQKKKIKDDLLVIGADNLFSFSLQPFLKFAQKKKPANSIVAYKIKDEKSLKKFGVIELNRQNKIIDFQEKPRLRQGFPLRQGFGGQVGGQASSPKRCLISTCIYFFPAAKTHLINQYLKQGKNSADRSGTYIRWLVQNDGVYGFIARGRWLDIGSIDEYSFVSHAF